LHVSVLVDIFGMSVDWEDAGEGEMLQEELAEAEGEIDC
jgi:hypothetical protein